MYAGGHCSMLCGVFHGTVGWSGCEGCVDSNEAYRAVSAVRRRHCSLACGLARNNAAVSRGGGMLWYDVGCAAA